MAELAIVRTNVRVDQIVVRVAEIRRGEVVLEGVLQNEDGTDILRLHTAEVEEGGRVRWHIEELTIPLTIVPTERKEGDDGAPPDAD